MNKEDYEKLILSMEGIKQREWNEIKGHIDKQFDLQFSNLTKEQALVINKDLLENSTNWMTRSFTNKSEV